MNTEPKENPENNEYLTFADGVVRSVSTDKVIAKLEPFFAKRNHRAKVTSVIRTPEDQLRIINKYALDNNLHYENPLHYGNPNVKVTEDSQEIYAWQITWSRLLNIGILINPPLRAKVLFDYWRNGINKKGRLINPSAHSTGKVFDIGGSGGRDFSVSDEVEILSEALVQDPALGILRFIIERKNNALHVVVKA